MSSTPVVRLPGTAKLTVKCLRCGQTSYEIPDALVTLEPVTDPDTHEFVQYDVTLVGVLGDSLYIEDLLCLPKQCSVFGRLSTGSMFAFPWLTKGRRGNVWHSRPDSKGDHYAMRHPR